MSLLKPQICLRVAQATMSTVDGRGYWCLLFNNEQQTRGIVQQQCFAALQRSRQYRILLLEQLRDSFGYLSPCRGNDM